MSSESIEVQDTRMMARAVKQRWPISDSLRGAIIARMSKIIVGTDTSRGKPPSRREVIAASRCVLDAEKINLAQEERDNPTPVRHEHSGVVTLAALLAQSDQLPCGKRPDAPPANRFDVDRFLEVEDADR